MCGTMNRTFKSKAAKWFPEGCLPECPSNFKDQDVLRYALEPGDVIAFHFLAVHGAPGVLYCCHIVFIHAIPSIRIHCDSSITATSYNHLYIHTYR